MKFPFTRCFTTPCTFFSCPAPPHSETLHLLPWPVEKKATLRSAHPCYSILMCLLHDIAQNSSEVMLVDIIPVTSRYVLGCFLSVSQQYLPLGGVLLQFLLPSGMLCSDQMYNKILLQSHSSKIYNFFHYLERTKNVAKRLTDPLSA